MADETTPVADPSANPELTDNQGGGEVFRLDDGQSGQDEWSPETFPEMPEMIYTADGEKPVNPPVEEPKDEDEEAPVEAVAKESESSEEEESYEAPTPEETAELREAKDLLDRWHDAISRQPAAVAANLFGKMDADTKLAIIAALQGTVETPDPFDPKTYEPQGELEAYIIRNWDKMHARSGSEWQQPVSEVKDMVTQVDQFYAPAIVNAEYALQLLPVLAQAAGIELPKLDSEKVWKEIQSGKSVADAVRSQTEKPAKKALERAQQARAQRPRTPGTTSTMEPAFKPGTSMYAIAQSLRGIER